MITVFTWGADGVSVCVFVLGPPTFHIAKLSTASTSSPSNIARIITHKGMAKETSGIAHTTKVPILKHTNEKIINI